MTEKQLEWVRDTLCEDDYPVFGDYLYFAEDKLIVSDIFGTVKDLKRDLISRNIPCENIYTARYKPGV